MLVCKYPPRAEWKALMKRPALDVSGLYDTVQDILDDVRREGDAAVRRYGEKFDKVTVGALLVSEEELKEEDARLIDVENCITCCACIKTRPQKA